MRGERELTKAGCHDHSCCPPCVMVDMCMWLTKPLPVRCRIKNSRTRTIKMITDTFTQRGVLGGELRSGLTRVLLLEDEGAMCVPSSVVPGNTDFFIERFSSCFS